MLLVRKSEPIPWGPDDFRTWHLHVPNRLPLLRFPRLCHRIRVPETRATPRSAGAHPGCWLHWRVLKLLMSLHRLGAPHGWASTRLEVVFVWPVEALRNVQLHHAHTSVPVHRVRFSRHRPWNLPLLRYFTLLLPLHLTPCVHIPLLPSPLTLTPSFFLFPLVAVPIITAPPWPLHRDSLHLFKQPSCLLLILEANSPHQ
mmetsp:Transcript_13977/g.42178  ORF Transcript_13977/g.42178 Transcript_13977/m.42178 type:complete len:200 (+) Transcript_13977:1060-1659(+)